MGLHIPHKQAVFFTPICPLLHRITFAVVSDGCQYHPHIRVTRSSTSCSVQSE
jgi:hypothetical protein